MSANAPDAKTIVAFEVMMRDGDRRTSYGWGNTAAKHIRKTYSPADVMYRLRQKPGEYEYIHVFVTGDDVPICEAGFRDQGVPRSVELPKEGNMSRTEYSRGVTFDTNW